MKNINSGTELRAAIAALEDKQKKEREALKAKFNIAYESIKPINFIKHTLKEAAESFDIKENLMITTVGITAGYLSEKIVAGDSDSPLRKLLGAATAYGVTNLVATHPEAVKRAGRGIFNLIGKMIGAKQEESQNDIPKEIAYRD